ncbi:formate C-acetyltransferase/glycerol dehydratase family glycyl radical enzyme [Caproiciproducens sp. NJN-50]|uniref:glycyl radical protein n=1 Tax=Acutalibacteraceae TaxID=3082771 RepID=UPI000FFE0AA9|nr:MULTISPECIES: formate C-acetyltransferase/glycerol dehydratase family glycyl radical enzyme [Acutalibacteraceae]QAT49958.1 formate C-acetyltransferase/glycerol dehydratase family glycyl radical enzyme [Caproiciproducens sp. NJN-50]
MAKKYMERIEALRKQYLDTRVDMDVYNAKYLTEGFRETEGQPWSIQKATGFLHQCRKKNIYILDDELLVGGAGFKPRCGILCADSSCSILDRELDTISTRKFDPFYLSEEGKKIFKEEVSDYWKNKCLLDRWRAMAPDDMETLRDNGMIYIDRKAVRGYGETTPGWTRLLQLGIGGIRKEAEEALARLDDAHVGDLEKIIFLKSELIACEGIVTLANRHADLAGKMAAKCEDPMRRAELEKIAEVCRWVPEHPARNFYEACQSILFYEYAIYMEQNASSYNLGRLDQYLYPYYKADRKAGILDDDGAQTLLDCLWIKVAELSLFQDEVTAQYAAGYCITVQVSAGGIDQYGNDAVNPVSYMLIQAVMDVRFKEPNTTIRYNISKNPDSFLRKAVEAIRMGLTMPAVYHDDAGIRMLLNKGVPLSEAWDWNPCGCVETNLSGRMKQYTDMADINMGGIVEMALNDGVSRKTGKRVSVSTGDPSSFKTFNDFFEAVKTHIRYFVDVVASGNQLLDYLSMNYRPVPALSLTYPHCIESATDYSMGGAKYNCGGGVITVGQADIVNSLAAVKYLIYDEKAITMKKLCNALAANFDGYEDVRKMCMEAPKYGNDDDRADFCVGEVFTYVVDQFEKYDTKFGRMTCGMLPVSGNTPIGEWVGALPSGRRAWTPLTDGIGATGGTDTHGPTALLKSVSHIPHARYTQGTQLNMKLEPAILAGEDGLVHGMNLLKTLCTLDVYHVQFNVVDRQTLLDAQAHPEKHKDLLIRVAGYTAFFVELGKDVQDEIIGRTEISSWSSCGCGR